MTHKNETLPDAIYTIGHSTLTIEAFIDLLKAYGIETLADVRAMPRSKRNPQFNGDTLSLSLRRAGIAYVHMKDLGGLRLAHKDSVNTGWPNDGFRGYADYMQTEAFADALRRLIRMSRNSHVAIMCAEAAPSHCHRSLVADALAIHGVPVVEILSKDNAHAHKLTAFARIEDGQLTYPQRQPRLL